MKKYIFLSMSILFLLASCKKEGSNGLFDYTVSGLEKIDTKLEETHQLHVLITKKQGTAEKVYLSLENVPEGVSYRLDQQSGIPDFAVNLELKVSKTTAGGLHTMVLRVISEMGEKLFPLEMNVDRSLSITFTIFDATTFNPDYLDSDLLPGAVVSIYKNDSAFNAGKPAYTQTTNSEGKANFYSVPAGRYLFTIKKDDLGNIVQPVLVNGISKGFVAVGMFRTQQEIAYSAQPNAKPGDLRFKDLNADNKIDENDRAPYDALSVYDGDVNEKITWIGK